MQVLIEVKKKDNGKFEGIVIFPAKMKDSVEKLLIPSARDLDWRIHESDHNGYLNVSANFSNSGEASCWVNELSDRICSIA